MMIRAPLCLWLCLSALLANNVAAQTEPVKPCPTPAYRAFDFWLGEWEVRDAKGTLVGHNVITAIAGPPSLVFLDLRTNEVLDIEQLEQLPALEELVLWDNPLSETAAFANHPSLTYLGLQGTQVSELAGKRFGLADQFVDDLI